MPITTIERRKVLLAISHIALAAPLVSCGQSGNDTAAPQSLDTDLELLASVIFDLFPYPELPAELYVKAAEHILGVDNPLIADGLSDIRQQAGNLAWKDVAEDNRIAILKTMQDGAFFAALRAGSLEVLYRSPEVFELVGYGGSAIEQGGYINRGFDDIDWLPEQH